MQFSLGDHERLGQEEVEQGGHHRPAHLPGQEVGARVAEAGSHHVAQYVDLAADTESYLVLSTAELAATPPVALVLRAGPRVLSECLHHQGGVLGHLEHHGGRGGEQQPQPGLQSQHQRRSEGEGAVAGGYIFRYLDM